jgi:fimbrial isopeptide formation D2 family protein
VNVPTDPFVGENVTFTLQFDNTHASLVGYGPYIDLILPATGADGAGAAVDDGITFLSATYLGAAVTAQTFTFPVGGTLPHPYARNASNQPITVTGTPGHQLVVLQLPFGSFTPTQPPADIVVTVAMSNQADVGTALTMRTRGGFRYGADALDNPPSDPSIIQASFNTANVTPTLLRLRKTYIGPEDETATGPNFPRQYRIEVDVATGQTIQSLAITDLLPNNLQFLTVDSTLINGGASATTATATPSTTVPGGTLTRTFTSNVTGTAGTNDATMIFSFFVPRVDASSGVIINANTGDDVVSNNEASSSGTWDPIDSRDAVTPVTANGASPDHILTDKSIAIQKSVSIFNDTGVAGYSPGDTLQYTLTAQISDYFAFQNLVVTDTLGDGLREDGTFTPTLAVSRARRPVDRQHERPELLVHVQRRGGPDHRRVQRVG